MEGQDPRIVSYVLLTVVVVGGMWAIRAMLQRFGAQAEERARDTPAPPETPQSGMAEARAAAERGDWTAAAAAYQRLGKPLDAARALRQGRQWRAAAELYAEQRDFSSAAKCLREAGDPAGQARMLAAANDWAGAAEAAEAAADPASAAEHWVRAGQVERAVEVLRKSGQGQRAARLAAPLAESRGDWSSAAQQWQVAQEPQRALAALEKTGGGRQIAALLAQLGQSEAAAQRYAQAGADAEAAALFEGLGAYRKAALHHQKAGHAERAIQCLTLDGDKVAVVKMRLALGQHDEALRVAQSAQASEAAYLELLQLTVEVQRQRGDKAGLGRALSAWAQAPIATDDRITAAREAIDVLMACGDLARARAAFDRLVPLVARGSEVDAWLATIDPQLPGAATRAVDLTSGRAADGRADTTPEPRGAASQAADPLRANRLSTAVTVDEETMSFPDGSGGLLGWPSGVPVSLATRYEGLSRIGQGGNGVVYRATDKLLGRQVVLKFMLEGTMPSDMARKYFLREVKMAAALNHPNIVHIYDVGEADGMPWYAMEFIDGRPLTAHMQHGEPVRDRRWMVRMLSQLCAALDHAHAQGMVHRDIKPDNVLVAQDGTVKLLDFGLARILDEGFGEQSVLAGTPYYMAPEQLSGGVVDHRADIYALGVVLFRMLAGVLPFTEGNVFVAHAIEPVPDLRTFDATLPADAIAVVERCLAKKADDRFDTCAPVAAAIERAFGSDAVSPPS
jgi:tRNA A-37 threonylcarbamoyl transferase component Bud32